MVGRERMKGNHHGKGDISKGLKAGKAVGRGDSTGAAGERKCQEKALSRKTPESARGADVK